MSDSNTAEVESYDIPDGELGCHHNEICGNCGVDVYRVMKYCYECGKKLIFKDKKGGNHGKTI